MAPTLPTRCRAASDDSYPALSKVKHDFRTLKADLREVRPVWVRNESRTRRQVFCCLRVVRLSRELERRLCAAWGGSDMRSDAIAMSETLLALWRLCLLHYPANEKATRTNLPQPEARQQEILAALGITIPTMQSGSSPGAKPATALPPSLSTKNHARMKR